MGLVNKLFHWLFPKQALPLYRSDEARRLYETKPEGYSLGFAPDDTPTEELDDWYFMRDGETLEEWCDRLDSRT